MIDRVRFVFGLANIVVLPLGLLFWFIIHPWAHSWRKLGPTRTYSIVLPALIVIGAALFPLRVRFLGADLGTSWVLIAVALIMYGVTFVELPYWKQLRVRTLVGVQELSLGDGPRDTLLTDGAYGVVRHPRYLSAGIGVIGNALLINHTGMYVLILALFLAGMVMLMLEERELIGRFGEQYRQYQRDVPQIIPRFRSTFSRPIDRT